MNIFAPFLDHWLTLHSLFVLSGLIVYVTSSHTLRQRRNPSAAIAWVLSLVLLPYIALPLYLIFGSRKLADDRPQFNTSATYTTNTDTLISRTQQLAAIMALPPASNYKQLNLHQDGTVALQALLGLIKRATKTIDLCTFMFSRDELGEEIARNLIQRAHEGIRVRLLIDGVGAYLGLRRNFKNMTAAGIQVTMFVPPLNSTLRGRTNLRNHRKMLITDSVYLWCGGRNLADEYFAGKAASTAPPWTDLSFDLQGELALQAQQQFNHDWLFATTGKRFEPKLCAEQHLPAKSASAQLIASGPDQLDDTYYTVLVSAFFACRKRILMVTPYFVPEPTLLMSLTLAARRGVSVDLILPEKSNHRLADFARHRSLRELVSSGVRVWFMPNMIHAKAVVVDDEIAFAGSANLDARSLFLNYELMIAFYEATDVKRIAQWISDTKGRAALYKARPPGLPGEIAEGLLLWLAFQL